MAINRRTKRKKKGDFKTMGYKSDIEIAQECEMLPITQIAEKAGIDAKVVSPKDYENRAAFNEGLLTTIRAYKPDLIVLAGFLVVIPEAMIEEYENRIINIHPSLIPSFCGTGYYGLKVHEAALARGVKLTGATVHYVDKGTDTGPILLQKAVEVKPEDTPEILQRRVMEEAEWKLLPAAINMIANGEA